MPKLSRKIHRLPPVSLTSLDTPIPANGYVEQLINVLGTISDKVEETRPKKHPGIRWRQQGTVEEQQHALCIAVVDGANAIFEACTKLDTEKKYPSKSHLGLLQLIP